MHIPEAVLDWRIALATDALAVGGLALGVSRLKGHLRDRTTVLMGTMASFVFAGQMVNFPLYPLPISGHLMGGVLSAVLLGPWAGAVVMAAVLIVQCFLYADGGVTALGANFLNMGLIGCLGGYAIYDALRRKLGGRSGVLIGAMAAAWFSVILSAGAFAMELGLSGNGIAFFDVLGWMVLVHAGIGLGEAVITGLVLRLLLQTRPDLIHDEKYESDLEPRVASKGLVIAGVLVALAIAVILAPLASEHPDGLEWVGEKLGFLKEGEPLFAAPLPDYQLVIPGIAHVKAATAAAGVLGTVVVFGVAFAFSRPLALRAAIKPPALDDMENG